jgi:hypothetical protein
VGDLVDRAGPGAEVVEGLQPGIRGAGGADQPLVPGDAVRGDEDLEAEVGPEGDRPEQGLAGQVADLPRGDGLGAPRIER